MDASLGKKYRLRKRREFLYIQRTGKKVSGRFATLIARFKYGKHEGRVGLTVSKAIGKAHDRNFIKRRLRHILRENRALIRKLDLVIIAKPAIRTASFEALKSDLLNSVEIVIQKFKNKPKKLEKK